ncbi:MAG: hypothetical protein WCF44_11125 [Candidatus Methylophosphatis roskildensis]
MSRERVFADRTSRATHRRHVSVSRGTTRLQRIVASIAVAPTKTRINTYAKASGEQPSEEPRDSFVSRRLLKASAGSLGEDDVRQINALLEP